jgi:hypothetical protein
MASLSLKRGFTLFCIVQLYPMFCIREQLNKLNKQQTSERSLHAQEIQFNDIRTPCQR